MLFRIRVDEVNRHVQEKLGFLLTGHEHVLVKHVLPTADGNPHYHAYADLDFKSPQALRYNIDKRCSTSASQRSVTECDPERKDEFIQYLFNTKHGNIWSIISSTIDTTEHQARAAAVSKSFAEANPPKEKKAKGPTMWDLAMETHQTYVLEHVKTISSDSPSHVHRAYAEAAVKVCRKHHKVMCDYTLQKIVQTAMTERSDYASIVISSVVRRLTPRE